MPRSRIGPADTRQRWEPRPSVAVSVVIPCLDEGSTITGCVRDALHGIHRLGVPGEVIVVDNGSVDDTAAVARAAGAVVIVAARRGYGYAVRAGIAYAKGTFVVMADGDGSYDLTDLRPFYDLLEHGHDLVVGNRFTGRIAPRAMPLANRLIGNPVLSWCGRRLFRVEIGDFHCGIRAFRRSAVDCLGLRATGMEFASELIARASLAGLTIAEVPTTLHRAGRAGRSHLRPIRDAARHLVLLGTIAARAGRPKPKPR